MPYNRKAFSDDYATETFYFPLSVQVEDEDSEDRRGYSDRGRC